MSMIHPVSSVRSGDRVWVKFSSGHVVELGCPPELIGDPIAREIVRLDQLRAGKRQPEWQTPDAGEQVGELTAVMRQIPDSQWRGIDCEPGWYPLVIEAHHRLREIAGNYSLGQVSQSKARLRMLVWHGEPSIRVRLFAVTEEMSDRSIGVCEWCGGPAMAEQSFTDGWAMRLSARCTAFRNDWVHAWSAEARQSRTN